MSITENIVTGRKYRRITSTDPNVWERISFWTMAEDVELDDGTDLQTKLDELETRAAGTANVAQVLNGYTFSSNYGVNLTGTMNNWGSNTVNMSSNTATLSAGYYSSISINAASRYTAGYNAKTMTQTSLGTFANNTGATLTYNCKSISGYANLTTSNFGYVLSNAYATVNIQQSNFSVSSDTLWSRCARTPSLSYNASNGVLTLSNIGGNQTTGDSSVGYTYWLEYMSGTVYCYHT